ncbi:hypothetical protein CHARACLAT_010150 [Characodon lateralis]|uniref:Uncharacterized protein n=1 Tax=Characodon lateralis TaxID=208331 RepID=A0ABU7F4Z5_9TELE|nr:hypothetical protein [Characodon lateralis]
MLRRPTYPSANRSQGQEPQKEALEEGHHSTPKNPSPEPDASPTDGAGTEVRGAEIQDNPNDPERAEEPTPAPKDPQDPNLNPSPDPDQKARSLSWPPTPRPQAYLRPLNVVLCT